MPENAPIILFCYNRPEHTQRTVEALLKNKMAKDSELFIFCDGPKLQNDERVKTVRQYLKTIKGFKSINIFEGKTNKGLSKSVIDGVSKILLKYDKVIVLEDDLLSAPSFLENMNLMLEFYQNKSEIFSVSGYVPPVNKKKYPDDTFVYPRTCSWGWGTWRERWNSVDWEIADFNSFITNKKRRKKFNLGGIDMTPMLLKQMIGEIDSWAIRFSYSCFIQGKVSVYPILSQVQSIGTDGSGTHIRRSNKYGNNITTKILLLTEKLNHNEEINKNMRRFYANSVYQQFINYVKRILYIRSIR